MPPPRTSIAPEIRAAGAICWRIRPGVDPGAAPGPATMELLMVRSARWGNWSWPKGKLGPVEQAPVGAVREVAEETGVRPRLGLPLPSLRYVVGDGRLKHVDYWVGHVDPARQQPATAGSEEIAEIAWVPADEAIGRLEWPAEAAPALHLFGLATHDRLRTSALLVVRHAKARKRSDWRGQESERPLTQAGRRQAEGMIDLLDCWAPETVHTSPWTRCVQTITPYVEAREVPLLAVPALTEKASQDDPEAAMVEIQALVDAGRDAAVCTHRPVLADAVQLLRTTTAGRARASLPRADPWLRTAEVLVTHLRPGGGEVVAVERHRPSRRLA